MGQKSQSSDGGIDIQSSCKAYGYDKADEFGTAEFHACQHISAGRLRQETKNRKGPPMATLLFSLVSLDYRVDSISKPQASSNGSGMYLEFLFRRAHSRSLVERKYWSGESLYSRTTCSNSVMVGVMGPIGSGFPQLGFPRRLAIRNNAFFFRDKI